MTAAMVKFPVRRIVRVRGAPTVGFLAAYPDYPESRVAEIKARLETLRHAIAALQYDRLCTIAAYRAEMRRFFGIKATKPMLKQDQKLAQQIEAARAAMEEAEACC